MTIYHLGTFILIYVINIYGIGICQISRVLSSLPLLLKGIQESKQNCKSLCKHKERKMDVTNLF